MASYSDPADLAAIMPSRDILELAVDDGQIDDMRMTRSWPSGRRHQRGGSGNRRLRRAGRSRALAYVPPLIRHLSSRIARYRLHARRSHMETPKAVVRDYEDALRNLSRIASGAVAWPRGRTWRPSRTRAASWCPLRSACGSGTGPGGGSPVSDWRAGYAVSPKLGRRGVPALRAAPGISPTQFCVGKVPPCLTGASTWIRPGGRAAFPARTEAGGLERSHGCHRAPRVGVRARQLQARGWPGRSGLEEKPPGGGAKRADPGGYRPPAVKHHPPRRGRFCGDRHQPSVRRRASIRRPHPAPGHQGEKRQDPGLHHRRPDDLPALGQPSRVRDPGPAVSGRAGEDWPEIEAILTAYLED
ncbi:DUF1320 domain-containing protein [Desulfolutivibrio sulfodismutans DSM 3696]|nr:DUF1320 domain-containing protein [Desulfolutivibrio sulfodismutans DSM 3696]